MNFLKTLLSPRSRAQQENKVSSFFSEARVEGHSNLHPQYMKILNHAVSKSENESKFLNLLLSKLESLSSLEEIVKCFTVVHRLLINNNYSGPILECIENAQLIINQEFRLQNQQEYEAWFVPFYKSYIRYLVKAASNAEIMIRSSKNSIDIQTNILLNDLFRLVNQLNTILIPLNHTTKIVGRYYGKKLKVFEELYNVLQTQFLNIYQYFRVLIDCILRKYEQLSLAELQIFIIAIPQYELMLDQLQEILMCKYFKGTCKYSQPHVLAQDIAKMNFHISCQKKQKECLIKDKHKQKKITI